jgi:DNA-directed RNA polymerase subunit N (RpoN/RPB10)
MDTGCCMIPVKCFQCGNPIAALYRPYKERVLLRKKENNEDVSKIKYLTSDNCERTVEAEVMDELGVTSVCCRLLFMTHRDI